MKISKYLGEIDNLLNVLWYMVYIFLYKLKVYIIIKNWIIILFDINYFVKLYFDEMILKFRLERYLKFYL